MSQPSRSGAPAPRPRLFDRLRQEIRVRGYSPRTAEVYERWVRRYLRFHGMRPPRELGADEVAAFLSHLATEGRVAATTQNQALAALLFLYGKVLRVDLPWIEQIVGAKESRRLPVVLTPDEVTRVLAHVEGTAGLVAALLYGAGLRGITRTRRRQVTLGSRHCHCHGSRGGVLVRNGGRHASRAHGSHREPCSHRGLLAVRFRSGGSPS